MPFIRSQFACHSTQTTCFVINGSNVKKEKGLMSKTQHAYSIPTAHANPVKLLSMVGALRTEVTRGLSCLGVIIIKKKKKCQ